MFVQKMFKQLTHFAIFLKINFKKIIFFEFNNFRQIVYKNNKKQKLKAEFWDTFIEISIDKHTK